MFEVKEIRSTTEEIFNQKTQSGDFKIINYEVTLRSKTIRLSRSEMEIIFRAYSRYGEGLTQQHVGNQFSDLTTQDTTELFQALRRKYKLVKNCEIFAPHEDEELTSSEREDIRINFQLDSIHLADKSSREKVYQKSIEQLKAELSNIDSRIQESVAAVMANQDIKPYKIKQVKTNSNKALAIWLADMHIGARVDSELAIKNENLGFNFNTVMYRIERVIESVMNLVSRTGHLEDLYVFQLGDAIDGIDSTTSRRDVSLPQNMGNAEQINCYIKAITYLLESLIDQGVANNYHFRAVGESNHGGIAEYAASLAIEALLQAKGVDAHVSKKSIGQTIIQNTAVVYAHGKDAICQKKPWGYILDPRTKSLVDDYLESNNISLPNKNYSDILVVKGDSHNSATTGCEMYDYKSVGSLFGGSNWAQANFTTRRWQVDMSLFVDGVREDSYVKDSKQEAVVEFK